MPVPMRQSATCLAATLLAALNLSLLAMSAACAPERPPASVALESGVAAAPAASRPPPSVPVSPEGRTAPPSADAAAEKTGAVAALKPLADALDQYVLDASPHPAWMTQPGGQVFFLSRRRNPAVQLAGEVPYPPAANEAALGGRVVTMAEVWTVKEGELARVMRRPIEVAPMLCDFDEGCALVTLAPAVTPAGNVEIAPGTCPDALAHLDARRTGTTTFDAYDRAVIPTLCRAAGTFAWNGSAYAPVARARTGAPDEPSSKPPPAAARVADEEVVPAVFAALFPDAIASSVEQSWSTQDGQGAFVLFHATYAAPQHAFFSHRPEDRPWESGRSVEVAEVWLAREASFRRVLRLPVSLASLGEPNRVASLSLEPTDDGVLLGAATATCAPDARRRARPAGLTAVEAAHFDKDDQAVARLCRGRGRYAFDGRRLAPARAAAPAHAPASGF